MSLTDFHFIRPWWVLLGIPLLFLFHFSLRQFHRGSQWRMVCDAKLLPHLLVGQQARTNKNRLLYFLLWIPWLLIVLALAGPSWSHTPQPVFRTQAATVLLVDQSPSMLATDILPSRSDRINYKIMDLLSQMREGQVGLVVFSEEPFVVSPITEDAQTLQVLVPTLSPIIMPVSGNNISAGLKLAASLFKNASIPNGNIILFSDSEARPADLATAQQLSKAGINVSVLSIGTSHGGPINSESGFMKDDNGQIIVARENHQSLRTLAQAGGGVFTEFSADDADLRTLNKLLSHVSQRNLQNSAQDHQENSVVWLDQGNWFLAALLPWVLLVFRRGWLHEVIH